MLGDPAITKLGSALAMACAQAVGAARERVSSDALRDRVMDPAVAVCDPRGRVLSSSSMRHLGPLGAATRAFQQGARFDIEAGDSVAFNDPFSGGTRVQDFYVLRRVDVDDERGAWILAARATAADIGGEDFGSFNPEATEIWAEGVRITPVRICTGAGWVRDMLACVILNSRAPRLLEQELRAVVEGLEHGADLLAAALSNAPGGVPHGTDELLARSAERARQALGPLVSTAFSSGTPQPVTVPVPGCEAGAKVRLEVVPGNGKLILDLSASDPETSHYHNATRGTTLGAALSAVSAAAPAGHVPVNDGLLDVLDVVSAPGTVVQANYPRPTARGVVSVASAVVDAVGALSGSPGNTSPGARDPQTLGVDGRLDPALASDLREDEARMDLNRRNADAG